MRHKRNKKRRNIKQPYYFNKQLYSQLIGPLQPKPQYKVKVIKHSTIEAKPSHSALVHVPHQKFHPSALMKSTQLFEKSIGLDKPKLTIAKGKYIERNVFDILNPYIGTGPSETLATIVGSASEASKKAFDAFMKQIRYDQTIASSGLNVKPGVPSTDIHLISTDIIIPTDYSGPKITTDTPPEIESIQSSQITSSVSSSKKKRRPRRAKIIEESPDIDDFKSDIYRQQRLNSELGRSIYSPTVFQRSGEDFNMDDLSNTLNTSWQF